MQWICQCCAFGVTQPLAKIDQNLTNLNEPTQLQAEASSFVVLDMYIQQ
jgi:hypothetical protein